jgi:N-acyl-D-amino-acid deacylase
MHHTGGWDTSLSGDPEMMSEEIAKALGVPEPTNCGDWIRYKLGKPLDFQPGSKYFYSNFGYCVMSRVIEKITGKNYYDYLREKVFSPVEITDFAKGYTLESQRQAREVKYYDYPGASLIRSALPPHALTTAPYGWAQIEALEGMGGWIGSAIDLTHFVNSVDGSRGAQFLAPATMEQFLEDPHVPGIQGSAWYGLGIVAADTPQGLYWTHNGGCPGTVANVAHRPDGYDWGMVLNSRSRNASDLVNELIQAIDDAINVGMSNSGPDLYDQFHSTL